MKKETWQWTVQGRMQGEARFTAWELRTEWGLCLGQATRGVFAWPSPPSPAPCWSGFQTPAHYAGPSLAPLLGPRVRLRASQRTALPVLVSSLIPVSKLPSSENSDPRRSPRSPHWGLSFMSRQPGSPLSPLWPQKQWVLGPRHPLFRAQGLASGRAPTGAGGHARLGVDLAPHGAGLPGCTGRRACRWRSRVPSGRLPH